MRKSLLKKEAPELLPLLQDFQSKLDMLPGFAELWYPPSYVGKHSDQIEYHRYIPLKSELDYEASAPSSIPGHLVPKMSMFCPALIGLIGPRLSPLVPLLKPGALSALPASGAAYATTRISLLLNHLANLSFYLLILGSGPVIFQFIMVAPPRNGESLVRIHCIL